MRFTLTSRNERICVAPRRPARYDTDQREMDMSDRITDLEEQVAYLSKTVDELSDVIARQDKVLDTVTRRLQLLMQRAAEQELDAGGSVPLADQKPPHW